MYLIFFGFGFQSITSSGAAGGGYIAFLTPGIMAFQVVIAGTVGGACSGRIRRYGMLSQLLVGPFTRFQYLLGIMLTSLLFGLGGALVMLGAAYALLGTAPSQLFGVAVMFGSITLGSIYFGALMLFISALVKSNTAYNLGPDPHHLRRELREHGLLPAEQRSPPRSGFGSCSR